MATKRLHPAYIVTSAVRTLRNLAVPLLIALVSGGGAGELFRYLLIIGVVLIGIGGRALDWWRMTYEITPRELRVHSGVFSRQERALPLDRIQSVDVNEGLLQRLMGVVQVRVETAAGGGAGSDVTLDAVTRAEAAELRARLMAGRRMEPTTPAEHVPETEAPAPELIVRLSPGRLLAAGVTSGRVGPALALVAGAFQFADDIVGEDVWERVIRTGAETSLQGIVVLVLIAAVGAWLLAIGSMVLTFGGFELRRDGDRLLISHGLLERRRSSIPLTRVQAVTVSEGVLRQPFRLASVRIESAGYGRDTAETGVLAPLVRMSEVRDLLARACPPYAVDLACLDLARPPDRARRRYVTTEMLQNLPMVGVAVVVAALIPQVPWWWGLAALVLVVAGAILGLLRFHDAGWTLDEDGRLIVRERPVARVTAITVRRRLQRRSVSQDRLQRHAALATFDAAVASGGAGGRMALRHLDVEAAFDLLGRLRPRPVTARRPAPAAISLTADRRGDHSSVNVRNDGDPASHDEARTEPWRT